MCILARAHFPVTDYAQELPKLKKMTREEVVAHVRRASNAYSRGASNYHGVTQNKSGRWEAFTRGGGRQIYLGIYDTGEDASRVSDFAVLSLRGVDTQTAINFDKGAYLGADGNLLPVEAALSGLGCDKHRLVREKLAAAVVGAGGAADGGGEDVAGSSSESDSDSGNGIAGLASPARPTGHAAVGGQPPACRRGPAPGGGKADQAGEAC
ncbi:hypothetical protein FOA52_006251 [Chlamydomonas sp. UWO 241]|nr:hypothetical protein FOA52_006251 [Chlamydomonas sp. UWO 241]